MNGELHRGKLARAPVITSMRNLTREDLAILREKRPPPAPIKQYREAHHRLARLIAAALPDYKIAEITGYSITRICTFKQNPAGQNLIAVYRQQVAERDFNQFDEMRTALFSNMLRAEKQIEAHLDNSDETGELLPIKVLDRMVEMRADRTGFGKQTTNVNVNVGMGTEIDRAIAASGKATVIEGEVVATPRASPEERWSRSRPPVQSPPLALNIRRRV